MKSPKLVAFYLPQFHPTVENDAFWGKDFTDWVNVRKARPMFAGHQQPHAPGKLGYYDLRSESTRLEQSELARANGIDAFCYYHYWFEGSRPLGLPLDEMMRSGKPDFPFCLCWANENWTRSWNGSNREILMRQNFSEHDDLAHIRWLAPILADPRYLRVGGKPLLLVYRASNLPEPKRTADLWREQALKLGVGEIFLCAVQGNFENEIRDPRGVGFDAALDFQPRVKSLPISLLVRSAASLGLKFDFVRNLVRGNRIYDYGLVVEEILGRRPNPYATIPCVVPAWDNSPRRTRRYATIFSGSTPELFEDWLKAVIANTSTATGYAALPEPIVFINAWNEWAEGSYLEPDARHGEDYLEAVLRARSAPSQP